MAFLVLPRPQSEVLVLPAVFWLLPTRWGSFSQGTTPPPHTTLHCTADGPPLFCEYKIYVSTRDGIWENDISVEGV